MALGRQHKAAEDQMHSGWGADELLRGLPNTLQIKAVAVPRSGEHQQVAAAVAL